MWNKGDGDQADGEGSAQDGCLEGKGRGQAEDVHPDMTKPGKCCKGLFEARIGGAKARFEAVEAFEEEIR